MNEASQVEIPDVLYKFALNNSKNVGEFLKTIIQMNKWDSKEMETFFQKYPGLRPVNKKVL